MGKFLSVIERLEALKDGKEIRKKHWDKDVNIALKGKHLTYSGDGYKVGDRVAEDLLDGDVNWELNVLNLSPNDLGKKIEYSDGSKGLIIGYECNFDEIIFTTDKGKYACNGSRITGRVQPSIIKVF